MAATRSREGTSTRGRTERATARRELWAIASQEALDGFRARRQLVVRALTPIILFACVLGVTLLLRGSDTRTHPDPYVVAVEGDVAGAQSTLAGLRPDRLVFVPSADARVSAISEAEVGLRVPDHLDTTLATGGAVRVDLYEITSNPPSRAGAAILRSAFVDLHTAQVQARLREADTGVIGQSFTIDLINTQRTERGTRTLTAQIVSGLLLLEAAMLVAGTANRLVSRRSRGIVIAQLLLPVSRRSLAFAKSLGELAVGLVASAPVVAAIVAFGAVIAVRNGSVGFVAVQVGATLVTVVVLFLPYTALGLLIGTAARTQEQVSLATGAAVIVAALVAATMAVGEGPRPSGLAVLPVAGSVSALRDVLDGNGSPLWFGVATCTSLAVALVIAAIAGRSLDAERMVLRNG